MPPRRARSAAQASSGLPGSGTNRRARASRPGRRPRAPHQPDERPTVATNLCFETVNRLRCTKQLVIQPHYAHLGWRLNATRTSRKVFASTKSDLECPHPSPMCPTHDGRSLSTQAAATAAIPLVIPQPRLTVLPKAPWRSAWRKAVGGVPATMHRPYGALATAKSLRSTMTPTFGSNL